MKRTVITAIAAMMLCTVAFANSSETSSTEKTETKAKKEKKNLKKTFLNLAATIMMKTKSHLMLQ